MDAAKPRNKGAFKGINLQIQGGNGFVDGENIGLEQLASC